MQFLATVLYCVLYAVFNVFKFTLIKMKYSKKFTLEISMKEFYIFAKPLVDKKTLHKAIQAELCQSWEGITSGEWGGGALDWKLLFYRNLYEQGIIEQTQHFIDCFGRLSK
jgi:hypothetical protein